MSVHRLRNTPFFYLHGATTLSGPGSSHYRGFTIAIRRITIGRTPLDEWSARCRELYVTTHNTHKKQTSMVTAGFEPTIPATEGSQTKHVNDHAKFKHDFFVLANTTIWFERIPTVKDADDILRVPSDGLDKVEKYPYNVINIHSFSFKRPNDTAYCHKIALYIK